MRRRAALQAFAAAASGLAVRRRAHAQTRLKVMVVVTDMIDAQWAARLAQGLGQTGAGFGLTTSLLVPPRPDPALQAGLIATLIGRKVDAIGVLPFDPVMLDPVLQSARDNGILVVTLGAVAPIARSWDIEIISPTAYAARQMAALAAEMGGRGAYAVYVGTLASPLDARCADAAIALQKARYPEMKLATPRKPVAEDVGASARMTEDLLAAFPDLGGILSFGAAGTMGAGTTVREQQAAMRVAVVGTVLPSEARELIVTGAIRAGFLWSPLDAGAALAGVAGMTFTGRLLRTGVEIPGLGLAKIDTDHRLITTNRIFDVNRTTLDGLIALGL